MSSELKELEARAMRLPAKDRERLANHLFTSLSDDNFDGVWETEIAHRIEKLENGTAQLRSIEEVFAEVEQRTA